MTDNAQTVALIERARAESMMLGICIDHPKGVPTLLSDLADALEAALRTADERVETAEPVAWADAQALALIHLHHEDGRKLAVFPRRKGIYDQPLYTADALAQAREEGRREGIRAAEKDEREAVETAEDLAFYSEYEAAVNGKLLNHSWEDIARILSGRLRQMDKRARAANKRADDLSAAIRALNGNGGAGGSREGDKSSALTDERRG